MGLSVGSNVVLVESVAEMFGRDGNRIFRVVDARLVGGEYSYTIAPELGEMVDGASSMVVYADDVRVVS